jgi:hypothetical protein
MSQVVCIFIGSCGVNIGSLTWNMFCNYQAQSSSPVFNSYRDKEGHLSFVFIDTDSDAILANVYKDFPQEYILVSKENAAGNFGRGYSTTSKQIIEEAKALIRKASTPTTTFVLYHAMAGGTGSSLGPMLLGWLSAEYKGCSKYTVSILPSYIHFSTSALEPYNVGCCLYEMIDQYDGMFLFDNDSMYKKCIEQLKLPNPTRKDLNEMIVMSMHRVLQCLDNVYSRNQLAQILNKNRNKYITIRCFPLMHIKEKAISKDAITKLILDSSKLEIKSDNYFKLTISPASKASAFLSKDKKYYTYDIVEPFSFISSGNINYKTHSVIQISNSMSGGRLLEPHGKAFDCLYKTRAYFNWLSAGEFRDEHFKYVQRHLEEEIKKYKPQ